MEHATIPQLPTFPKRADNPFSSDRLYPDIPPGEPISRVVMPSGDVIWLITSYKLVRQVLADPRVSADRTHPGFPVLLGFPSRAMMQDIARRMPALLGMDSPAHTAHRRIIVPEFTSRRVQERREAIQQIVDECIDDMLAKGSPADLMEMVAAPVPTLVICDALGLPRDARDYISDRTRTISIRSADEAAKRLAMRELNEFLQALVIANEEEPGPNVISTLIEKYRAAGTYDRNTMTGNVLNILHGGKDGPANTMALGTVAMLENPELLAKLRANPSLIPGAVEEMLRFFSSSAEGACYRAVLEDIELDGVTIPKGDGLLAFVSAANRDERVFQNPHTLDVERDARGHVAFGYGVHQCLGQHMARLEIEIVFSTLLRRVPGMRLAVPVEELNYKSDNSTFGIWEVPVAW